jgi:hypothetical protein
MDWHRFAALVSASTPQVVTERFIVKAADGTRMNMEM